LAGLKKVLKLEKTPENDKGVDIANLGAAKP